MIGKKLKEEEDKKNVKERGKTNCSPNKSSKPVNAVAKSNPKTESSGKSSAGKSSSSGSKSKMGGMDNGLAPEGKKQIDAPTCKVVGCKDRQHWGWCNKKGFAPCRNCHEVKPGQPGEPVGPEINKVQGRWTSHTKEQCRHADKHKDWANEPSGAGTT